MRWTLAAMALLLIPSYVQGLLALVRRWKWTHRAGALEQGMSEFVTTQVNVLFYLAFLPRQALVTLDAIIRTVFRLTVAPHSYSNGKRPRSRRSENRPKAPVDIYLNLTPLLCSSSSVWPSPPPARRLLLWRLRSCCFGCFRKPATKWLRIARCALFDSFDGR